MPYKEEVVARKSTMENGEMRQVSVGEADVLLVRYEDHFYALHAFCAHYGAPLAGGALSGDRIICPWHHSCYHAATGYQVEPPGLDSLATYDVRVEDEEVVVRVPEEPKGTRIVEMSERSPDDERIFVVLGGGAAGEYAAEGLREKGFRGRIIMITREAETPYDRPNCSKEYLQGEAPEEWMFLRNADFYADRGIERMHGRTVSELNAPARTLTFENGEELRFDGIVVCTGGVPRSLDVPGSDLTGIHLLRSYRDAGTLRAAGRAASRAVVIGASFIGMETAFSLKKLGVDRVTVVSPEDVPFARPFGERVGRMIRSVHEENGVDFRLGHTVSAFRGDGAVSQVVLDDGNELETDLVVVGIGVRPNTEFITGVDLTDDGAVVVDEHLRAIDGVYAAGDIAQFPDWRTKRPIRVEHWRLACQHGRLAGYNLAGEAKSYRSLPFFWTAHFGTSIRYVGHATSWDEIIYDGAPEDREFIAFYVEDDRVLAACGTGRDREMAAIEELLRRSLMPSIDELRDGGIDYVAKLSV